MREIPLDDYNKAVRRFLQLRALINLNAAENVKIPIEWVVEYNALLDFVTVPTAQQPTP